MLGNLEAFSPQVSLRPSWAKDCPQEKHDVDEQGTEHVHLHIVVKASNTFSFMPYKRALRVRCRLASHWSSSRDGYGCAVRHKHAPALEKPQSKVDGSPRTWTRVGKHPNLDAACHARMTGHKFRSASSACNFSADSR